jgi:hypothetical protein
LTLVVFEIRSCHKPVPDWTLLVFSCILGDDGSTSLDVTIGWDGVLRTFLPQLTLNCNSAK